MTPDEITNKLSLISRMTFAECSGWRWALEMDGREPFPGELAALDAQEAKLELRRKQGR